ncbi:patatin-like phospholipase family protein [Actibacterium sp. XHP0104]|uniref:patatin-like phospholipase family protein n=1 Tax=Actibacterium sp. XHP0104 TaxID=2984335 RepID=UPI0021E9472D|nr:patatin-like phospholipase family protein [Actibacterium sp. XHP0104]MCV2881084.1 patatin-like phospholipase family protein [Actibacterium sp. XHP0104]
MAEKIRINLALQGGGAHGAFTWGVLDRLLEDEDIEIAAITGTSAGAVNGAAFKAGIAHGGRDGARENLDWLWRQISGEIGDTLLDNWLSLLSPSPSIWSHALEYSMPLMGTAAQFVSPYYYGPFYQNPLQRVVEKFDFDNVCAPGGPCLFVCATNVRTGKVRVFTGAEVTTDAILASACLPTLFQAVEIDDPETGRRDPFWDGGYTGNPALFPLFRPDLPGDIVVVNINPLERDELPRTPQEIENRINEISFNASLLRELRAIGMVKDMFDSGALQRGSMKELFVHMIADDALMRQLNAQTKALTNPALLGDLKKAGRAAAEAFLLDHKDALGQRGTVDIQRWCS